MLEAVKNSFDATTRQIERLETEGFRSMRTSVHSAGDALDAALSAVAGDGVGSGMNGPTVGGTDFGTAVRCAHSSHSVDTHTRYNDVQNTGGRITCMLIRARHKATVKLRAAAETSFF